MTSIDAGALRVDRQAFQVDRQASDPGKTPAETVWDRVTRLSAAACDKGVLARLVTPMTTGDDLVIEPSDEVPWDPSQPSQRPS